MNRKAEDFIKGKEVNDASERKGYNQQIISKGASLQKNPTKFKILNLIEKGR